MTEQRVTLVEYERLTPGRVASHALARLRRFDIGLAERRREASALDWSRPDAPRARSRVGVLEVDGLAVEILPKLHVDEVHGQSAAAIARTRSNLLHMLSVARELPIQERDLADLDVEHLALPELFRALFARQLADELGRGIDHAYVSRRENLSCVKGRLDVAEDARRNALLRHRTFCEFDEFAIDTPLNRTLKAATALLHRHTVRAPTRTLLDRSLIQLGEVRDTVPTSAQRRSLRFHRNNDRFRFVARFADLILSGRSHATTQGIERGFAILFPMERLFEEYVGRMLWLHAPRFDLPRANIHLQSRGLTRWLLHGADGTRSYRLQPDIALSDGHGDPIGLLDTKWKRLDPSKPWSDLRTSDIHQLAVYAKSFECDRAVLLFPRVPGVAESEYALHEPAGPRLSIRMLDMGRDLRTDRDGFLVELGVAIAAALGTSTPA